MLILLLRQLSDMRLSLVLTLVSILLLTYEFSKMIGILFNAISNSGISISASGFASMFVEVCFKISSAVISCWLFVIFHFNKTSLRFFSNNKCCFFLFCVFVYAGKNSSKPLPDTESSYAVFV